MDIGLRILANSGDTHGITIKMGQRIRFLSYARTGTLAVYKGKLNAR